MPARLVPLSENSRPVTLDKAITLIGRHPDCDAVLDENQKISRRHCCIAQVENRLVLRDLGSMNGVRVNGEAVVEVDLRDGDEITIGDEEFVLELNAGTEREKRGSSTIPQTPQPPKRVPKPNAPAQRPRLTPQDISQEFPVAIPEDAFEDDLRLNFDDQAIAAPESGSAKLKLNFAGDDDDAEDSGPFLLDSGELSLEDLDGMGHPRPDSSDDDD